jgi:hypothetical protein
VSGGVEGGSEMQGTSGVALVAAESRLVLFAGKWLSKHVCGFTQFRVQSLHFLYNALSRL